MPTYPYEVINPHTSYARVYFRDSACPNINPDTGFLNFSFGEVTPHEYSLYYLGAVIAGAASSNSALWPINSPLPPGMRYEDQADLYWKAYFGGTGWDTIYVQETTYIDDIFPLYAYTDGDGYKKHNFIRNMGRDGPRNYQWYKQTFTPGSDSTYERGPDTMDDDSYWTGTCKNPLQWHDPFWETVVNYDLMALYLEEHQGCRL